MTDYLLRYLLGVAALVWVLFVLAAASPPQSKTAADVALVAVLMFALFTLIYGWIGITSGVFG